MERGPSVHAVLRQCLREVLAVQAAAATAVRGAPPPLAGARVEARGVSLLTGPHTNAGGGADPAVGQQPPQAAAGERAFSTLSAAVVAWGLPMCCVFWP